VATKSPRWRCFDPQGCGLEPHGGIVRLTVTHEDLTDEAERDEAAAGWAAVLSNLKSFLETGRPLPEVPWEVP
jgi:hypothetical protein